MNEDTWVIIPSFNEETNVCTVINKVSKYTSKIIIADDRSTDRTSDKAKENCRIVLKHFFVL